MRGSLITALFAASLAVPLGACSDDTSTAPETSASVGTGDSAPAFSKRVLGGGTFALQEELGPVLVIFLFGHACPICIDDAPDVEENVHRFYEETRPGLVKVIGADLWDGSETQVASFRSRTGATFPLLLDGSQSEGGNLSALYGPFDNYVVIDGAGTIVYHAADDYSHGNRYHLDEIREAVDRALEATLPHPGRIG